MFCLDHLRCTLDFHCFSPCLISSQHVFNFPIDRMICFYMLLEVTRLYLFYKNYFLQVRPLFTLLCHPSLLPDQLSSQHFSFLTYSLQFVLVSFLDAP
ncbi:hypothetical protein P9112_008108 [Eukaryota sp. TZLM1-RC]